jgi:ABC-2 type transport system ATP-binding protein
MSSSTGDAIEARGLSKRYGDVVAVEDLDLSIPAGTVYGFLGPNGAGKTTTIGMLTTLITPTEGTATVAGHPVSDRDAIKPHLGYLPDDPPLYDAFSAREQLDYVATLRGMDDDADERIEGLLARVGLTDDADRRIDTYSQGMRQKVGLVQAILHEPSVVFLDEPTNGLDPRAAREVIEVIRELAAGGATVFLSTHVLPVVEELADTVGVLHRGRLVAEGSPADLKRRAADASERTLEQAFIEITDDATLVAPGGAGDGDAASAPGPEGAVPETDGGDDRSRDGEDPAGGAR